MKTISIAKDFSIAPAGRYRTDGPYSGEQFRDDILTPALQHENTVVIDLNGALGYGSSFLEEAFGGLVRVKGMKAEDLHKKIRLVTELAFYEERIWSYIDDADKRRH